MKTLLRCILASAPLCFAVPLGAQKQHKTVAMVTPAPSIGARTAARRSGRVTGCQT